MANIKLRWNDKSITAYKSAGDELRESGCKALRELTDKDCGSVLTFWATPKGCLIMQTFVDTGDVSFFREAPTVTEALR